MRNVWFRSVVHDGRVLDTSIRLLRLLALLPTRASWSGPELAERLGVTTRTVRNDVERLRLLGYEVRSSPGVAGGYRLGSGTALPPLLLDDEEATVVAVAPPPDDWPEERRRSFHREYSVPMLREFMAHEALPGHALQLAHAAGRTGGGTRIRLALRSGPFVEGWALHAETLLAEEGWGLPEREEREVRLMNLKMRLRAAVNAVLDVRVHAHGMTEGEAMRLLVERGHCE